ncbi:MAG: YggS family pyridoxal phosphate-dependent enzyme [Deltaproteobacteria bacterium CG_4_10_14_0_2_um_filter_43_8]|nr:MAG: YggS family pyridoxal phosphate-dependent enzyme [Deltaproteobacteria bacterium CG11_big_fil_rev_8_21_14_0_20_42_23]PJA20260.1 MAG: YggS family pyridoxal phosphate-dependent enzyme [Deltaproteobacteria bacterium CG_4_10_14_0_2_um_filter_43_8]PJC64042.1 MAG: YggS family pyridoxal phosphate-dependent enzyme [Deltaproteobacteria bacterium CG_4_9_14_0_2_um_filter_42_21]
MDEIANKILRTKEALSIVCHNCGRDPSSVRLIAVSKKKSIAHIQAALKAGQIDFGENYAQEFRDKQTELASQKIVWHFIGHLQKNKVKYIAPHAEWIHTLDSFELAQVLEQKASRNLKVLLQVNIGDEEKKSGIAEKNLLNVAAQIFSHTTLEVRGLMCIPPFSEKPEDSRPYFVRLRKLLDELNLKLKPKTEMTELSMGMSHDYQIALEEGASMIRLGSAIFGER